MDHIRVRPAGGQRLGPGHPIVFLHAGVCDRRMWHAVAPRYAARGRTIAYDRRGYGLTRADPEDHAQVADLLAVLDALTDGEPAILVGASAGGRVALDMALLHPARVRALVLVAPNIAGAPAPSMTRRCKRRWTSCARQSRWRYGTRQPLQGAPAAGRRARRRGPRDGRNTDLVPGHERHRAARVPWRTGAGARPAYPRLADVAAPTLVAWGDLDFPHVQERSRHAARTIPGAEAREFVGAGHLPSLEDPAGFAALLDDFILRRAAVG